MKNETFRPRFHLHITQTHCPTTIVNHFQLTSWDISKLGRAEILWQNCTSSVRVYLFMQCYFFYISLWYHSKLSVVGVDKLIWSAVGRYLFAKAVRIAAIVRNLGSAVRLEAKLGTTVCVRLRATFFAVPGVWERIGIEIWTWGRGVTYSDIGTWCVVVTFIRPLPKDSVLSWHNVGWHHHICIRFELARTMPKGNTRG